MFGSDWLVAPVTTYGAKQWAVYLPPLNTSRSQWVYFFNDTVVDASGWITLPTTVSDFPLFYIRAIGAAESTTALLTKF